MLFGPRGIPSGDKSEGFVLAPMGEAVGGITPESFTGLGWWFDADDNSTITIDTGVSQWNSKGGDTSFSMDQATGTAQPVIVTEAALGGTRQALSFDGTDELIADATFDVAVAEETLFYIMEVSATSATSIVMGDPASIAQYGVRVDTTKNYDIFFGGPNKTFAATTGEYLVLIIRRSASGDFCRIYENGGTADVDTTASTGSGSLTLELSQMPDFRIAELIEYTRALAVSETNSLVNGYIKTKYIGAEFIANLSDITT